MAIEWLITHLTFFRAHVLAFLSLPLFWSIILWASNGEFYVKYIDSLFLCVSAVTGTGLGTIDLSALTAWQQTILVILEVLGSPVTVSWVAVMIRRYFFINHLVGIVEGNTRYKREVEAPNRGAQASEVDNQSATSTGVLQKQNGPPLTRTTRGMQEAPQQILSVDWDPDSHPPSGRLLTLSPKAVDDPSAISYRPPQTQQNNTISETFRSLFPELHQKIRRTVTMPRTATLLPADTIHTSQSPHEAVKVVPYLSFPTIVGKNSAFHDLTEDQLEEIGGIELRALNMLMWAVPLYCLASLAIPFAVVAPYVSTPHWKDTFLVPTQHRNINSVWFALFQVVGAFANTGMSLVDQGMVLFQTAYPMIIFLIYCILAGNAAFPIFLRFSIWTYSKVLRKPSKSYETACFLLDHPRRCFISMFPARQTWLLLAILVAITMIDWVCFLVFNIGNPTVDSVPTGIRVINGLLQSVSVRSAGFQVVPLAAVAPALKERVLYVVMMYIAVYPIAMSVRSTNVYEERSLGVFEEEEWHLEGDSRIAIWGNYLLQHSKTQMSSDMWWLAFCLTVMCLVEQSKLENTDDVVWFNIFSLIFEVVSAYGTVGLSLGIPTANYSFAGALQPGSKFVLCAVMLRGRHRGLPTSIDRAIMLPHEFHKKEEKSPANGQGTETTELLRSSTNNIVEHLLGPDGHAQEVTFERY